jgi:hypothetical protein
MSRVLFALMGSHPIPFRFAVSENQVFELVSCWRTAKREDRTENAPFRGEKERSPWRESLTQIRQCYLRR